MRVAGLVTTRGELPYASEVTAARSWHVPQAIRPYGTYMARWPRMLPTPTGLASCDKDCYQSGR